MMRSLLCFLVICVYSMSTLAKPRTLDRLILEINGKSYSQRQMEVYQALRTIAAGEPSDKGLPGPDTWSSAIDSFRVEMMIYINIENDAEKMEKLPVDSKAIRQVQEKLEALVATDDKWRDFHRRYSISDREVTEHLIRMFKVQAYLESRGRPATPGQGVSTGYRKIDVTESWFVTLFHATPHRLYDRARSYQVIEPLGG
ncbi:MAG TPA: hypothetical protein VFO10_25140 [Oligoflexus sp.]|uniref:hypothetical protein n=1 Tax=Oligoflexus sp. TaxID=1971216 RepID=UPI002D80B4CD|nr:hypothetical protein [Oligoflexus sp.]HET9240574.1 hypothetical protein [Oligoflexus sp.]